MNETWLDITDLPPEGREFTFDDQGLWTGPWRELGMPGDGPSATEPLSATLRVIPGDGGWLVTGSLSGMVSMVCDRCAKPTGFTLDHAVEAFEQRPGQGADETDEPRIRVTGSKVELDVGALLWEEFVLALPLKPLCKDGCAGLCPHCGADRNETPCDCGNDEGDQRMAVFRGLKVSDN